MELPQRDDENISADRVLAEEVLRALQAFGQLLSTDERSEWLQCIGMIEKMLLVRRRSEGLAKDKLEQVLANMTDGDTLALHIRSQNAGVIIRSHETDALFELFELSATSEAVMGAKGRLIRCFPGPSFSVDKTLVQDHGFRGTLVDFLVKADMETPKEMVPLTRKAGSKVAEIRDTVHPKLITEMLTAILRAIGEVVSVSRIYKNTRDDVLWKDARSPWRRSPFWLLLRVALQTTLSRCDESHGQYKRFMIFYMSRVLDAAQEASQNSDLLFQMKAKIVRRLLKLDEKHDAPWLCYTQDVLRKTQSKIELRWDFFETDSDPNGVQTMWSARKRPSQPDTELSLCTLQPYLDRMIPRSASVLNSGSWVPQSSKRLLQNSSELPNIENFPKADKATTTNWLVDVELWVAKFLDEWIESQNIFQQNNFQSACLSVAKLMAVYKDAAMTHYADKPEEFCLMVLTLMELWVALDTFVLHDCCLLREYQPGIPSQLFEPLLLPKKGQMKRLLAVEKYVEARNAVSGGPCLFRSFGERESFSVRFYDRSPQHQALHDRIEKNAREKRHQKILELSKQKDRYAKLTCQSEQLSCEYAEVWRKHQWVNEHISSCKKCYLERQAAKLEISVHEWPLPKENEAIKSVVFELDVPYAFSAWRDITFELLVDVFFLQPKKGQKKKQNRQLNYLQNYDGLKAFVKSKGARVQLASSTKPFTVAHYRSQRVSGASQEDICVNNGLRFASFDSKNSRAVEELSKFCDIREKCTLKLPAGPFMNLDFAINNTIHSSNDVIAAQIHCDDGLSLHEYYVFGTLRSGHRLQWYNIARELAAQTLNFHREETFILLLQAAWQAGPRNGNKVSRDSHLSLEDEKFGADFLLLLGNTLNKLESNWQAAVAVRALVSLAARLLSLSPHMSIQDKILDHLRTARNITLSWTRTLIREMHECSEERRRNQLSEKLLEIALSCHGTFDIDEDHIHKLLGSDKDVADLTECMILIHDHTPITQGNLAEHIRNLLRRSWRTSVAAETLLRHMILNCGDGLDTSIRNLWQGYRPGNVWTVVGEPNGSWLETICADELDRPLTILHYNLLSGSLLINGSPLTRLPQEYEAHPTYIRLLGKRVLDVIPSNMYGMGFEARSHIAGQQVHFGMFGQELIIRSEHLGHIYELLPVHALRDDFPEIFVQDFAHWIDIDTHVIEWRPLKDIWTTSPDNWRTLMEQNTRSLVHAREKLIDVRSSTAKAVHAVLSGLELPNHIHITFQPETAILNVHLPRLQLDFYLRNGGGQLESKQFRGMIIDTDQSLGTLTGLRNRLVLRSSTGYSRIVLIPQGCVEFSKDGEHVRVFIDTKGVRRVTYHVYQVDTSLGRLVDKGNLRGKLYRYYLHALTSHCLKDRLTGRTGTEEALDGLSSASVFSFTSLDDKELELLVFIDRLTTLRTHYPHHLRVMQQAEWPLLPSMSQHGAFHARIMAIFNHLQVTQAFQADKIEIPFEKIARDEHLLERALMREATNRVHGFGSELFTIQYDQIYTSRDICLANPREQRTFEVVTLVNDWAPRRKTHFKLLEVMKGWGASIQGLILDKQVTLGYHSKWLEWPANLLPITWCTLQATLAQTDACTDKYGVMFLLATVAYSQKLDQDLISVLLAFATVPRIQELRAPNHAEFCLDMGFDPEWTRLEEVVRSEHKDIFDCPEWLLPQLSWETPSDANNRRAAVRERVIESKTTTMVQLFQSRWPERRFDALEMSAFESHIRVERVTQKVQIIFDHWNRNREFRAYVESAQDVFDGLPEWSQRLEEYSTSVPAYSPTPRERHVDLNRLLRRSAPTLEAVEGQTFTDFVTYQENDKRLRSHMLSLLSQLSSRSVKAYEHLYVQSLQSSFAALKVKEAVVTEKSWETLREHLENHLSNCRDRYKIAHDLLVECLKDSHSLPMQLAEQLDMWPRLSPISLLQLLSSEKRIDIGEDWKCSLTEYGLRIAALQRATRLLSYGECSAEFLVELTNAGHQAWDPLDFPDWLLLEIDHDLLIRPVQAQVALEMISPATGDNSVMQLNMGEGKTSVIVPMVAAALADRKRLVRVVVLKQLCRQMFHVLVNKLSGITNRRILQLPFSRSTPLNTEQILKVRNFFEECMRTGSILLMQPEHLLSFELMGFDNILSGRADRGNAIIDTQRWLDCNSRDILDESDEVLSVRFELIYTMGIQCPVDFSPDRWLIVEQVLGKVSEKAADVLSEFPDGLEINPARPGSFPSIRVTDGAAGKNLLGVLATEICTTGLRRLPTWTFEPVLRDVLFQFLTNPNVTAAQIEPLNRRFFESEFVTKSLLLLRGLLAGGILLFALQQKRWRVDYGLDPSRTVLAVPYRAKDYPALRAEFSHPDVTIVLTCLSYYYGGLSDDQLRMCFETLLRSDCPEDEYALWVSDIHGLPENFHYLTGVNIQDFGQCSRQLFPWLSTVKAVVDFYLSHHVFPHGLKEFPQKLACSSWTLAKEKTHPTTGFSGTNDSRILLPLPVRQSDLAQQLHTNAAVLDSLLQPRNRFESVATTHRSGSLSATTLLQTICGMTPPVRVLIDVGAQVMEWQNEEVAREWLALLPRGEIDAAIFFNAENELVVLDRFGCVENFIMSPFARRLDECVVYLDEIHTRGTDLKLPGNSRAAVTLAVGLTKDRLVQACMRMRKLDDNQSVVFLGSREVQQKILSCNYKTSKDEINVIDVLAWAVSETQSHTRKCVPLWATQGMRHLVHDLAWSESLGDCHSGLPPSLAETLLEPEARDLHSRYHVAPKSQKRFEVPVDPLLLSKRISQVQAIQAKCITFETASLDSALLHEEQEQELSPENEQERQIGRPPAMQPWKHTLHDDVVRFVKKGYVNRSSEAFQPAFRTLKNTSVSKLLELNPWPEDLLVTTDFARTVQCRNEDVLDSFLRPVHWVLCYKNSTQAQFVIISPYEANELLPLTKRHGKVTMHIYSPRVNTFTCTMEHLSFCTPPALLSSQSIPLEIMQLNLFAGQLYLYNYQEYINLCLFLGLCFSPLGKEARVSLDGFIRPEHRSKISEGMVDKCPFNSSPVGLLQRLFAMRRKDLDFAKSHLGRILQGDLLTSEEF